MKQLPDSFISTGRAILVTERHQGLNMQRYVVVVPSDDELIALEEQFKGEFRTATVSFEVLEAALRDWRKSQGNDCLAPLDWVCIDGAMCLSIPVLKAGTGSGPYQILRGHKEAGRLLTAFSLIEPKFPVLLWSKPSL